MPTYEYRCAKGHTFEVFQKMSDPPVATCPECEGAAERMVSGGAGFLFKGEGFYITDYRSEDYKKKAQAEKTASGSPDAVPDKSSTKPPKAESVKKQAADEGGSEKKSGGPKASGGSGDSSRSSGGSGSGKSSSGTDG